MRNCQEKIMTLLSLGIFDQLLLKVLQGQSSVRQAISSEPVAYSRFLRSKRRPLNFLPVQRKDHELVMDQLMPLSLACRFDINASQVLAE